VEAVIIIFLLLFAILAFGWFYLQRAKARDAGTADAAPAAVAAAPAATPPAEPMEPMEPEAAQTDQPAS